MLKAVSPIKVTILCLVSTPEPVFRPGIYCHKVGYLQEDGPWVTTNVHGNDAWFPPDDCKAVH